MTNPNAGWLLRSALPARIPKPIDAVLERVLRFRQAERVHQRLAAVEDDRTLPERLLDDLEITYRISDRDLDNVPHRGPAVIVANHPSGILDGAVLACILRRLRPDVRFLANSILSAFPEIRDLLIPLDLSNRPAASRANIGGLRQALDHLARGGLLVIFPAGAVSHFRWKERSTTDPDWNPGSARLVSVASQCVKGVVVVPVYISGSNSFTFRALGVLHPRFRTAMLVRELLNKRRSSVEVRAGKAITAEKLNAMPADRDRIEYLRWRAYLLASRSRFKPRTALPLLNCRRQNLADPVGAAPEQDRLLSDVRSLPTLLSYAEFDVYLARACQIPAVIEEIGRLREVTFRAAGVGTGRSSDLDRFDLHYLHLFLWNREKREVVGAYRLAATDRTRDLYTATLFHYRAEFLERLGPALELGRSFVRAEYQRAVAPLLLLWKGIGTFVARNPRYKVLFGPVSISNRYQAVSRSLIVSFLRQRAWLGELARLVSSRNPFRAEDWKGNGDGLEIEDLDAAVSDVEPDRPGVPVLLRQYLKLGGKLLGFNVDSEFCDALDGLILVDLTKTEPKLLERYLGKADCAAFLQFHGGEK
jgi:putative hemolysin